MFQYDTLAFKVTVKQISYVWLWCYQDGIEFDVVVISRAKSCECV